MTDESAKQSPPADSTEKMNRVGHGERWLIISLLFVVLHNVGTPSQIVPLLFAALSALAALYAFSYPKLRSVITGV